MTTNDQNTQILYNPQCSKCRQTLQLLNDKGIEPEIIEYLKDTPNFTEIEKILGMLNLEPRELMRKGETIYTELNLSHSELSRTELIQAMIDNPKLIERPIVIKDGKAMIGRPPQNILDIIK